MNLGKHAKIHPALKLLEWGGIMIGSFALMMITWFLFYGKQGGKVDALRMMQLLQSIGLFVIPPIIVALLWSAKPWQWLHIDKGADWRIFLMAFALMIIAQPAINLTAHFNEHMVLPSFLAGLEEHMRNAEEAAAALLKSFMDGTGIGLLMLNLFIMAMIPAIGEELTFRGVLQSLLSSSNKHIIVWLTAFVFAFIHFQFYGFLPRMLMGAMFGYVTIWTGSLWVPILMHFTNNALSIIVFYWANHSDLITEEQIEQIGLGSTWWISALSIVLVTILTVGIYYLSGIRRRGMVSE